mgnify:CR=1 FL=1
MREKRTHTLQYRTITKEEFELLYKDSDMTMAKLRMLGLDKVAQVFYAPDSERTHLRGRIEMDIEDEP